MPTGLQTPASAPDTRPPDIRAKAAPPAARSGPEFSSTLREKRTDLGVEAAADPAVRPDTTRVTTDRAGTTDQGLRAGGDQPREAAPTADAAAQGGRDLAQDMPTILPTGLRPAGPAGSEPVPVVSNPVASQSAGGAAPATAGPVPAAPQGPTDPLPPVQSEPTAGPEPSNGGTQQQSTGTGADTSSGRDQGQPGANHPAIGRAVQVQAAVVVENVVGHPVYGGPAATLTASGSSEQPLTQTLTGLNAEETATTGRVIRGLTAMLQQRGGSMTMRLDPPALGQLRVQMTIVRGAVTAEFQPTTMAAQALLDRSIATLRAALESQGLTVERLVVHAAPSSTPARETADDQSQQGNQSSRNHADAGDGRSRGRGDDPSQQGAPNDRSAANFADAFEAHTATDTHPDRTGAQAA